MVIVKTETKLELKELKKSKDKSYTVKTAAHIAIGFALSICYSKDIKCKNINTFVIEKIVWKYLLKRWIKS